MNDPLQSSDPLKAVKNTLKNTTKENTPWAAKKVRVLAWLAKEALKNSNINSYVSNDLLFFY